MSTRSLRYNTLNRHVPKSRLASTDRDALAFLEAATIYNENQQRAIIELVRRLKAAGLWSKMKAIYPFVGGTATTHKWNLKDPQDTDAAFRLTFVGGWTHSANGADPDGSTGYANTHVIPSTDLANDSAHGSVYNRENTTGAQTDYAAFVGSANDFALIAGNWTTANGSFFFDCWNAGTNRGTGTNGNSSGHFVQTRTSTTSHKLFRNGSQLGTTNTSTASGFSGVNIKIWLSTTNINNSGSNYSGRQLAFSSFGNGLSDSEVTAYTNIVDLYQKRLGRAV